MGFREVEVSGLYGLTAPVFFAELTKAGLEPKSMIAAWAEFDRRSDQVAEQAKILGVKYVVCGNIPTRGNALTPEECRMAIGRFNRWAEALGKAGLTYCYHPHGPEFQPSPDGTLFDTLVRGTREAGVEFELDTFWVVHGGEDAAGLLRRYPGRFPLSHIKDKRKGTPLHVHPRDVAEEDSVVLGTGMVDWKSFLREAQRAGMKHYFIEEEHPDAVSQIPESVRYLRSLQL
jgi:sugar phosphate isomerase/epimerase